MYKEIVLYKFHEFIYTLKLLYHITKVLGYILFILADLIISLNANIFLFILNIISLSIVFYIIDIMYIIETDIITIKNKYFNIFQKPIFNIDCSSNESEYLIKNGILNEVKTIRLYNTNSININIFNKLIKYLITCTLHNLYLDLYIYQYQTKILLEYIKYSTTLRSIKISNYMYYYTLPLLFNNSISNLNIQGNILRFDIEKLLNKKLFLTINTNEDFPFKTRNGVYIPEYNRFIIEKVNSKLKIHSFSDKVEELIIYTSEIPINFILIHKNLKSLKIL